MRQQREVTLGYPGYFIWADNIVPDHAAAVVQVVNRADIHSWPAVQNPYRPPHKHLLMLDIEGAAV